MRSKTLALLSLLIAFPLAGYSQESKSKTSVELNDTQALGQRIFRQRCGVCHTPPTPGSKHIGPSLYKELIIGNEETMREFIANGSKGKMPGFRYGLEPAEINAIVEYLKTVPRETTKSNGPGGGEPALD